MIRAGWHAWIAAGAIAGLVSGCGGPLVRLAKDQNWVELDRRARAQAKAPRGPGARAWAQALVELDHVEEARAVLLTDFRHGGQERSMLALAELELGLGLRGIAAAHYTRLIDVDLDSVQGSGPACELLRERAHVLAALGEPLAADADMRRLALTCPNAIDDQDRAFLTGLRPAAQAQARGQRSLPSELSPTPEAIADTEAMLGERLELARKRSARALIELAERERVQLEPDDVASLLAAEFAGGLGPGFVSAQRLSAWIGDNPTPSVIAAIEGLPDGVREYGLLRLSSVRTNDRVATERQVWLVAAMQAIGGQGAHEAAKGWRVAASVGDLGGAEFALNTNLRDMIPVEPPAADGVLAPKPTTHWSLRVPVDRRSFDLLLTLARLFELREQPVWALELRRAVIVAGYEAGLAQVGPAAADEVVRQLALGHPWQALAVAEIVPGPLVDEVLPAITSALALARAAKLDEPLAADRNVVWRALGDPWFEAWDPRLDASNSGLDLRGRELPTTRCPALVDWLEPSRDPALTAAGLDPEASRAGLTLALAELGEPATGAAMIRAIEADLGLACSAPLVQLLHAGPHALALATLDERLTHAPELSATAQLQLAAEVALAAGASQRAMLLTLSAAAESVDPRSVWARAAVAGRSFGAREHTLEALRQVVLHTNGLDDPAARRELLLVRLRDVDSDEVLRGGDRKPLESMREGIRLYLEEAPVQQRWARLDDLLWALAAESRADAQAWALLAEVLAPTLTRDIAERHPAAVAALAQAGSSASAPAPTPDTGTLINALGDVDAICEHISLSELEPLALIGAATACDARTRAHALAALTARLDAEAETDTRAQILAGPIAAEIERDRPGALRSVPALAREGLDLRVAFDLPLEPVWVAETSTPGTGER